MRYILITCLLLGVAMAAIAQTPPLAEPWQTGYVGPDATGPHVLGYWEFTAAKETADSSGKGHHLELAGAQINPQGRFGGALESFKSSATESTRHAAFAKSAPGLSPKGAFSIEMWINLKPDSADYGDAYLVDKKYVAHSDYQMILGAADKSQQRRLVVNLGFGSDSDQWASDSFVFKPGTWYHLAFTYDGAGFGRFYRDSQAFGGLLKPRGPITPGRANLSLGDRLGSYYHGFPGLLDNVRITEGARQFSPASFAVVSNRTAFVRQEKGASLRFTLTNLRRDKLPGARASISIQGQPAQNVTVPELAPGAAHPIEYTLNTALRPGEYQVAATVVLPGEPPFTSTEKFTIYLTERPNPQRMPVVMWGANPTEYQRLKDCGFTHCAGLGVDMGKVWTEGKPTLPGSPESVAKNQKNLDLALVNGLRVYAGLSPGRYARDKEEFQRVDRSGKPTHGDVCGRFAQVRDFCYNVGASAALGYGAFPAWDATLVHTEVRSESRPCFHEHDRQAFKQATGLDIPAQAAGLNGVLYSTLKDFPSDRVIPDDYPIYVYYKWLLKEGDGWNDLHSAVDQGVKSAGRPDLWTFHDPAVRTASVWGSGGKVDYLSQWTYSYPDPIRIGLATDELFAMAQGRPGQQVMKMTQVIWYRSQTAPEPGEEAQKVTATFQDQDTGPQRTGQAKVVGYQADWEQELPDARFITIAPMHLREALWTKLSRPIQGIMYHGWGSLVPAEHGSYRYTHPATKYELKRLVDAVVTPLGPSLKQIPDRPNDVAFLESFAAQMLARRGTYGWNGGWAGDAYLVLNYAQLQPEIIYDEMIQQRGLKGYKVLVLADCDVLTRSVVDAIKAFQRGGGIVIGDQNVAPAIQPDILLKFEERPKQADQARAWLQAKAAALRKELDPHYQRYYCSDNPDVITRARRYGTTDYLFAINDRREFGGYVGHHKLVMENGLPSDATLTLARPAGHVYDLLSSREIKPLAGKGALQVPVRLGPCDGQLLMVSERAVAGVKLQVAGEAKLGQSLPVSLTVVDDQSKALDAVVPVKVELIAPDTRAAEFSGYYGARDGKLSLTFDLAPNDLPGVWQLKVQELASGKSSAAYFRVN